MGHLQLDAAAVRKVRSCSTTVLRPSISKLMNVIHGDIHHVVCVGVEIGLRGEKYHFIGLVKQFRGELKYPHSFF